MQFPQLCSFERLNYSVVLVWPHEAVLIQKSVTDPSESVTENITSFLEANAEYSIVVLAATAVWTASTAHHNFSECLNIYCVLCVKKLHLAIRRSTATGRVLFTCKFFVVS